MAHYLGFPATSRGNGRLSCTAASDQEPTLWSALRRFCCKSRLLTDGCRSAISLRAAGFDPPALTLSTQPPRYAIHRAPSGWRPGDQRCEPPQVLGDGGQNKLILGASWTAQSKPAEPQDALEVRKPHLDLLALAPRLLKVLGASERSGNVAGMLMDIARDLARWLLWAALGFERAYIAVELAGAIQKRLALVHGAARPELLSARAVVDVTGRIISKVAAREGAVVPLRLVVHRNMGRDALLLDQPVQHRSRPVGGIGRQADPA